MRFNPSVVSQVGLTCALAFAFCAPRAMAQSGPPRRKLWEAKVDAPLSETLPVGPPQEALGPPPRAVTLREAKALALQNSRVMRLASLQINEKQHAATAASKDFFPKLLANLMYFNFNQSLGTVVTTQGHVLPARQIAVPVINQSAPLGMLTVAQPVTALYKVRQAVRFAQAEVGAAQAQMVFARREIAKGVEEVYVALLILKQSREATVKGVQGAAKLAQALGESPEAKIVEVEARSLLSETDNQILQLETILNDLLDWPLCTTLVLSEPLPIQCPVGCEAEAAALAVQVSPKVHEARQLVAQADAGLNLAKSDYVPSVNVVGTYVAQNATPLIQNDFTGVGVMVNHKLFEWGKKNHVLHQRQTGLSMAVANLRKTEADVRLAAIKAFQNFHQAKQTAGYTGQIAGYYAKAKLPTEPYQVIEQTKQRMKAETKALEAQIALRAKYAELMALLGLGEG